MKEIWKEVPGFEKKYQASTWGRIKSLKRKTNNQFCKEDHILKQVDRGNDYLCVSLGGKLYSVHTLIVLTFPEICGELLPGMVVNHKDENRQNNNAYNLEVTTQSGNVNWGSRNSVVSEKMTNGKLSKKVGQYKDGVLVCVFPSASEVTRSTGFNQGYISLRCREGGTAYGFEWRYI